MKAAGSVQQLHPTLPQMRNLGLWCFSAHYPRRSDGRWAAPWWSTDSDKDRSGDSANGEMLPKRATSQLTKIEKETRNLLGFFWGTVQSLLGDCVSKGSLHAMETNP